MEHGMGLPLDEHGLRDAIGVAVRPVRRLFYNRSHMGKLMLSLFLGALTLAAADNEALLRPSPTPVQSGSIHSNSGKTLWRASVVALAATNIMDVQSSWGKRELNPALAGDGGAFGPRGALLKAGITGGVVALEFLVLRHGPSTRLRRALAVINFGDAAMTGVTAGKNWRVPGR